MIVAGTWPGSEVVGETAEQRVASFALAFAVIDDLLHEPGQLE